jgi:multidrug efflux pump subunit AcrA (membrane-fusion protein)
MLLSCTGGKDRDPILTAEVERRDYENKIKVPGVLESVKTVSIVAPQVRSDLIITWLIDEGTHIRKGDTVCILEADRLEEQYTRAVDQYNIARAEYQKSKADLDLQYLMLQSQVNSIDISTSITKLDSLQLQFTTPLERKKIELELQKAEVEKEKIQSKLKFLRSINQSEMKKMELRVRQQMNQIERATEQLSQLVLTSNVDGLVMYAENWRTDEKVTEGDEVWGRMPILEIPQMDELQAKIYANETQYKQIQMNQSVEVHVDANPELRIPGRITRKPPMGRPIQRHSPVKVFDIIASLDSAAHSLSPGLSINCNVFIQRVSDTLVVPTVSIFEEDSLKLVYVEEGRKFRRQPVKIALGDNKFSVIQSGLGGGEKIATSRPPESSIIN